MPTNPKITAKFTWSREDYQQYLDLQSKLHLNRNWPGFFMFAAIGAYIYWFVFHGDTSSRTALAVAGALALVWVVLVYAPNVKRRFNQLRLAEYKNQLIVTENVVCYDDGVSRCEYDWEAFLAYNENGSHSALWINRWLGICIPNRAFESNDDMIAYKKLASEKTAGKTLP